MKSVRTLFFLLLFAPFVNVHMHAGGLVETIKQATEKFTGQSDLAIGVIAEKQKQLQELIADKQETQKKADAFALKAENVIPETQNLLDQAESALAIAPDDEYLKQRVLILGETLQVVKDVKRAYDQYLSLLDRFISFLTNYLQDSDFNEFRSQYAIYERAYHAFDDILKLHDQIIDRTNRVNVLIDQEKSSFVELESRRQSLSANVQAFKKKQADLSAAMRDQKTDQIYAGLTDEQLSKLLALEEVLFNYRKILDQLNIARVERKVSFTAMELFIEKTHLTILKEYLRKAKPGIRVSELDIADEKQELTKEKKRYYAQKENYRRQIDEYGQRITALEKELHELAEQLNVSRGRDLDEWDRTLSQSAQAYVQFCRVAGLNSVFLALDYRRELVQAQEALAEEKYELLEKKMRVKESYYRAVVRSGVSEQTVVRELKQYDAPRARAKANISRYEERARRAAEALGESKRVLDRLGRFRNEIQEKKNTIFKSNGRAYNECLLLINQSEARVRERIDILGRLTGAYSNTTSTLNDTVRLINFISDELSALIGVLSRSEHAVTWDGFKNIIADIGTFFNDLRSYVVQFKFGAFVQSMRDAVREPFTLFSFLLQLSLVLFLLFAFRAASAWFAPFLLQNADNQKGFARALRLFGLMVIEFIQLHFAILTTWIMLLAAILLLKMADPYLVIFFYLSSIPILLYIARQFLIHFRAFNQKHDYVFIGEEFERRFMAVIATLLYATVAITLFRHAFALANYYKSELPTILLALNFIVFQTALMLLLTKDLILNLIPMGSTPFWRDFLKVLREYIDRYFILIQIAVFAIIVMSNPYVGFGKLVVFMFRSFVLTSLLFILLYWLYGHFKKGASRLFFVSADDVVHERFVNAKTWFGLVIVGSFALFSVITGFITARIWGWSITSQDVLEIVHEPLMFKGMPDPITLLSLAKIALFIFGGFALSYIINRFVLDRIFNLFLVEAGVQHTVTSIARYLVIGTAILLGFTYVGLGQHIGVLLAALVFSIGWVLKDPISDFAAYFIILVQRPLKIGDYVQIDDKINGVVRKITPRSIVLRRKNSTTLIIPNSYTINQTIENWNYTRNFVAFNDIILHIDYKAHAKDVKDLLAQVVEEHPNVLRNPKPIIRLQEFTLNGYEFMIRGYISPVYVLEMWDIASDIRIAVMERLRENGIEVAAPVWKTYESYLEKGSLPPQDLKKEDV